MIRYPSSRKKLGISFPAFIVKGAFLDVLRQNGATPCSIRGGIKVVNPTLITCRNLWNEIHTLLRVPQQMCQTHSLERLLLWQILGYSLGINFPLTKLLGDCVMHTSLTYRQVKTNFTCGNSMILSNEIHSHSRGRIGDNVHLTDSCHILDVFVLFVSQCVSFHTVLRIPPSSCDKFMKKARCAKKLYNNSYGKPIMLSNLQNNIPRLEEGKKKKSETIR